MLAATGTAYSPGSLEFLLLAIHMLHEDYEQHRFKEWVGYRLMDLVTLSSVPVMEAADRKTHWDGMENALKAIFNPAKTQSKKEEQASETDKIAYMSLLTDGQRTFKSLDEILKAMRGLNSALAETREQADANRR